MRNELFWFPWNGSKRWLSDRLVGIFNAVPFQRFVDPFVGSGAISYAVRKSFPSIPQLVGDANPWLVSVFLRQLVFEKITIPDNIENVSHWRNLSDQDLPFLSIDEKAIRFVVCLMSAWGNRWETHANGVFRSTIRKDWATREFLIQVVQRILNIEPWLSNADKVVSQNWSDAVAGVVPGDLIYLDPPFPETLGYGNQVWRVRHLLDLIDWAKEISEQGVWVVVSNVEDVARLFERVGFNVELVESGSATKTRRKRTELIAYNFNSQSCSGDEMKPAIADVSRRVK